MPDLPMPTKPDPDFTEPIEFPMGVVLYPSTDAQPAHRVSSYDPPRGFEDEGIMPGRRSFKGSSRDLDKAYGNASRISKELFTQVRERLAHESGDLRDDLTFQEVLDDYLDPDNHPSWGENYAKQQCSLARTWLGWVGPEMDGPERKMVVDQRSKLEFRDLRPAVARGSQLSKATKVVHAAKKHGTYANVHKLVVSTIMWARKMRAITKEQRDDLLQGFEEWPNEDEDNTGDHPDMPSRRRLVEFIKTHSERRGGGDDNRRWERFRRGHPGGSQRTWTWGHPGHAAAGTCLPHQERRWSRLGARTGRV